jgi:hypothetical protein
MDWFDRKLVEYVLRWAPYGRLRDEDVFPEFGMATYQVYERFSRIVSMTVSRATDLDDLDRALVDRARRHQATGPGPGK